MVDIVNIGKGIEAKQKVDIETKDSYPVFTPKDVSNFKSILRFLNNKDRDILYLIFVSRCKQSNVQRILDRSQPSLHYDIKRIRGRLEFIHYLNSMFDVFLHFIQHDAREIFTDFEISIMTIMYYTTSLTTASEKRGITPMKVRYTFDRCVRKLEQNKMWDIYEILIAIRNHLNIIKRTYSK